MIHYDGQMDGVADVSTNLIDGHIATFGYTYIVSRLPTSAPT